MVEHVPTTDATLSCLCGAVSLPGSYLQSSHFPLDTEVCYCNPCRYVTGGLVPTFETLKSQPPTETQQKLSKYQFGPRCIRWFCTECGTHCFINHPEVENEWFCNTGIIDVPTSAKVSDVAKISGAQYVTDAVDGATAPLFLSTHETSGTLFPQRTGTETMTADEVMALARKALDHPLPGPEDKLTAKCHCGGVSLSIDRADYEANPHKVTARMIPDHKNKYIAWYCVCRSCRLATGFSLQPMVYIPPAAIKNAQTGKPVVFGKEAAQEGVNEGLKLKHFFSSDNVQRSFCFDCGASVFYTWLGDDGDGVVDVSAGILRAESGAMARDWVHWKDGHLSHEEEMLDRTQAECVKRGWKAIGLAQRGS
jgi:hypothetical protein